MSRCPGRDMRHLTVSFHACPNCHKPVEFFSDEQRARCPHCKTMVHKAHTPACIQWCKSARECFGKELYDQLIGQLQGGEPDDSHE
jgi:endogenous inhibitor of DNA gyrase (YacG/DUF329 family)